LIFSLQSKVKEKAVHRKLIKAIASQHRRTSCQLRVNTVIGLLQSLTIGIKTEFPNYGQRLLTFYTFLTRFNFFFFFFQSD
jgi:hypothetical protein